MSISTIRTLCTGVYSVARTSFVKRGLQTKMEMTKRTMAEHVLLLLTVTFLQSKMNALIESELKGATYFVDLTTEDGILHADPGTVETVIDSLRTTFRALTSGGDSSATDPRFPVNGFPNEPPSYIPLVHLLNKIVYTANQHLPPSRLSGLRFHPFGGEVKGTFGGCKGLKPDVVGVIGGFSTKTKKHEQPELSWEMIEVTVESRKSIRDIVRQSGTYARYCLLSNQRRFFSLGIGFQYKSLDAYIFVYHRSGLSSSRPLKVTTPEGFNGLVGHIVGMLSFKDEAAYGLDTARTQNMFFINNLYYKIDRLLYVLKTLRGRSTIVYSLRGMYTCVF
jgi:Fungal protein kinase